MRTNPENENRVAIGSVGRVRNILEELRVKSAILVTHAIAYQIHKPAEFIRDDDFFLEVFSK